MIETSNIVKAIDGNTIGAEADGVKLNPESYVSMNFWGFPAKEGCALHTSMFWNRDFRSSLRVM